MVRFSRTPENHKKPTAEGDKIREMTAKASLQRDIQPAYVGIGGGGTGVRGEPGTTPKF